MNNLFELYSSTNILGSRLLDDGEGQRSLLVIWNHPGNTFNKYMIFVYEYIYIWDLGFD